MKSGWLGALSECNALPFETRFFEIEDNGYREVGDAKVVEDLAAFEICNAVYGFGFNNDLLVSDEIGNKLADFDIAPANRETNLLCEWYLSVRKFDGESVLVVFLK